VTARSRTSAAAATSKPPRLRLKKRPPTPPSKSSPGSDPYVYGEPPSGRDLRQHHIGIGGTIPAIPEIRAELDEMVDVLMGRTPSKHDNGVSSLQETANAYYSRAMELTLLLQRAEADGVVLRGSKHYKLRTGELRTFAELALRATDLGSRRLTLAQLEWEARHG
jgi:hypothetical protein